MSMKQDKYWELTPTFRDYEKKPQNFTYRKKTLYFNVRNILLFRVQRNIKSCCHRLINTNYCIKWKWFLSKTWIFNERDGKTTKLILCYKFFLLCLNVTNKQKGMFYAVLPACWQLRKSVNIYSERAYKWCIFKSTFIHRKLILAYIYLATFPRWIFKHAFWQPCLILNCY